MLAYGVKQPLHQRASQDPVGSRFCWAARSVGQSGRIAERSEPSVTRSVADPASRSDANSRAEQAS